MNTDFQNVFDQILTHAKLAVEKMMERVFVFSDMEFDQASSNPWDGLRGDKEEVPGKRLYGGRRSGVLEPPASSSTPVPKEEKGVALVSGSSTNQLKLSLDVGRALTPAEMMQASLTGDEYEGLVIFD